VKNSSEKIPREGTTVRVASPDRGASLPELHRATPATATLQPATLGVLALGSRGLDIWRREQDVA
jgi:hypothetical protein